MNVRLLGVLVTLIGLVFAYISYVEVEQSKMKMAGMDIQDYYRKTTGEVFRDDLIGVSRQEIARDRDAAQQHITWALILAAIGFAVAVAAKGPSRAGAEATDPERVQS